MNCRHRRGGLRFDTAARIIVANHCGVFDGMYFTSRMMPVVTVRNLELSFDTINSLLHLRSRGVWALIPNARYFLQARANLFDFPVLGPLLKAVSHVRGCERVTLRNSIIISPFLRVVAGLFHF